MIKITEASKNQYLTCSIIYTPIDVRTVNASPSTSSLCSLNLKRAHRKDKKPTPTCKSRGNSGNEEGQADGGPGGLLGHAAGQDVDAEAEGRADPQSRQVEEAQDAG